MDALTLNENLIQLRCYYCNRFLSEPRIVEAANSATDVLEDYDLKTCCKALITARKPLPKDEE